MILPIFHLIFDITVAKLFGRMIFYQPSLNGSKFPHNHPVVILNPALTKSIEFLIS